MKELGFLTYNTQYGKNLREVLGWIESIKLKIDIYFFQEFPEEELEAFREKFAEFTTLYVRNMFIQKKFCGQVVGVRKGLEVLKRETVDIGPSRVAKIFSGNFEHRNVLVLKIKSGRKQLWLANVHLTPYTNNSRRRRQLAMTLEKMGKGPAVVGGDFNYFSFYNLRGLERFMENAGFKNETLAFITHRRWFLKSQLDYVFSREVKLREVETVPLPYSDHYPILARIQI